MFTKFNNDGIYKFNIKQFRKDKRKRVKTMYTIYIVSILFNIYFFLQNVQLKRNLYPLRFFLQNELPDGIKVSYICY